MFSESLSGAELLSERLDGDVCCSLWLGSPAGLIVSSCLLSSTNCTSSSSSSSSIEMTWVFGDFFVSLIDISFVDASLAPSGDTTFLLSCSRGLLQMLLSTEWLTESCSGSTAMFASSSVLKVIIKTAHNEHLKPVDRQCLFHQATVLFLCYLHY